MQNPNSPTPDPDPNPNPNPQGWPKFAQSVVLFQAHPPAVVIASLLPLSATVPGAGAVVHIDSSYPFGDTANITVAATRSTTVKVRIPAWASAATVNGESAPNGTMVAVACAPGNSTISVELNPQVRIERGWGNTVERQPEAGAVAVVRGPLVFALHPTEDKKVLRNFSTAPAHVGSQAPDYLISTNDTWNYALDLAAGATFVEQKSPGWSLDFPFDDSGEFPFYVAIRGREVSTWGYWRGSNITDVPPVSPVDPTKCGPSTLLRLVPFGSTNIRVGVFPYV